MTKRIPAAWAVVNQTQPPAFQQLLEKLTVDLGTCVLLTGTPFPTATDRLRVVRGVAYSRRSTRSRLGTWVAFSLWAGLRLARERPSGPVLLVSNPPLVPLLGVVLGFFLRQPVVVLVWDIYPEAAIRARLLREEGLAVRLWRRLQSASFSRAAAVVTIGREMARVIAESVTARRGQLDVRVIPNWADDALFARGLEEDHREAGNNSAVGALSVLYAGNIGDTHDLEGMIHTALRLSDRHDISFRVVGAGAGRDAVGAELRRHGLRNVKLEDPVPWVAFPQVLWSADVGIVSQRNGLEDLSMPSKTYSYLAAGLAILAFTDPRSDLGRLVVDEKLGAVVPPGDSAAAEKFLLRARSDPQWLNGIRQRARTVARERYSEETALAAWSSLLKSVVRDDRRTAAESSAEQ